MDLDTALLRAFVAVADEGNFGKAAQKLFITQQGLSKRIARLEGLLGVRLVERDSRRVELTRAGEQLLPHAREAVQAVEAATAAAGAGAPLRVDVMDEHSAAMGILRRALDNDAGLSAEPFARGAERTALESLAGGDVDVAFGRATDEPWPREFRRRCVLLEPLALLVGADHPFAELDSVPTDKIREVPLRFPLAGAPRDWVDYLAELARDFGIEVDTTGCSIGFEHFLDHPAEHPESASLFGMGMRPPLDPRLRVIPLVAPVPVFPWAAMWRRRFPESAVNRIVGAEPAAPPAGSWLPEADRMWITSKRRDG